METRTLAAVVVTFLNKLADVAGEAAKELDEAISADTDGDARTTRRPRKDDDEKEERSSRRSRSKDDDDDEKEEKKGSRRSSKDEDDEPSEDDVVDAVRAAQKVLERNDVAKLVKKYGRAERSKDVKPENRQALIEALEKAVEDAAD